MLGGIVCRDGVKNLQPDESGKTLRDFRPGDKVMAVDRLAVLLTVEIYA